MFSPSISTVMPEHVSGIPMRTTQLCRPEQDNWDNPAMTIDGFETMVRQKHHRESTHGGSQRQLRVGELVRHALADMLTRGEVHDPVIEGHMITIPEVQVTADLRLATIYVMPLGGRDAEEVVAAFERHKKFLRAELAHRINLKFAPDIRFRVDDRFAEAERIDQLLRSPNVRRDLKHDEDDE